LHRSDRKTDNVAALRIIAPEPAENAGLILTTEAEAADGHRMEVLAAQ